MLISLCPSFWIYVIVIYDEIQKDTKFEDDKVSFKAFEGDGTWIRAYSKVFANFDLPKSCAKLQGRAVKEKMRLLNSLNAKNVVANIGLYKHTNK